MTTIVVGGHSRNVGKTSVTAGLIRAFREYPWTAVKISSHRHANIPAFGCEQTQDFCDIYEETNRDGASDTSRFLAAGAVRSLWMEMEAERAEDGMRRLLPVLQSSPFVMIESNRILRLIQPDLCIMVLRYDIPEFKESAREALRLAHAVVAVNAHSAPPPWEGVSEILSRIPQFATQDPQIIPAGLVDLVRLRLQQNGMD